MSDVNYVYLKTASFKLDSRLPNYDFDLLDILDNGYNEKIYKILNRSWEMNNKIL